MAEKEVKGPEFQAMGLGGNPRIQFKNHSASIAHKHKKRFQQWTAKAFHESVIELLKSACNTM